MAEPRVKVMDTDCDMGRKLLMIFCKQPITSIKQGQQYNAIFPIPRGDTSFSGFQDASKGLWELEVLVESLFLHFF